MSRKGQIWSTDLLASIIIVMFIMLFFIIAWNELSLKWNAAQSYRLLFTDSLAAGESLFTTPGDPPSWHRLTELNITNVNAIGIVNERNEINNKKIERLSENNYTHYNLTRSLLGLDRYEVRILITDIERNSSVFEMGEEPGANMSTVSMERYVIVNGSSAIAKMEVYIK